MNPFGKILLLVSYLVVLAGITTPAFADEPKKILIVPGHDDAEWGTEYRGVKEADMTAKLGGYIYDLLAKDPEFQVHITRRLSGYTMEFARYFETYSDEIDRFVADAKESYARLISNGQITKVDNGVAHNDASSKTAHVLFGINKWVDENDMDAVIHIHFNDYPRANTSKPGIYSGFTIYIPEKQFQNGERSLFFSTAIFASLRKQYPVSTLPKESFGIVPEQDLIAIGSRNTLSTRSILIEYGYIYEPRFNTFKKRDAEFKKMARLTYEGIKKYFDIVKVIPEYGK